MKLTSRLLCLGIVVLTIGLVGCNALFRSDLYSVKRVSDGDTIVVTDAKSVDIHVRFACIDAPERNQALGQKSKQNLERLIAEAGNRVLLDVTTIEDQYRRRVAIVRTKQSNKTSLLQLKQIEAGLAWPYEQFASDCPIWDDVKDASAIAKRQRVGIWSKRNSVPPWEFRKQQRQGRKLPTTKVRGKPHVSR